MGKNKKLLLILTPISIFLSVLVVFFAYTNSKSYQDKHLKGIVKSYSEELGIYLPDRVPNYYNNRSVPRNLQTIIRIDLSANEQKELAKDILSNTRWKAYNYSTYGKLISFTKWFDEINSMKISYFCIYDEDTKLYAFPKNKDDYLISCAIYNSNSKCIYLFSLES